MDWTLTSKDLEFVLSHSRGVSQHIKLAAQLCYLRKNSVFITPEDNLPLSALSYLANQFNTRLSEIPSFVKSSYSYVFEEHVCHYLNYRKFSEIDRSEFESWIINKLCKETLNKEQLKEMINDHLRNSRIVLPSSIALGRLVNKYINQAFNKFYIRISKTLPQDKSNQLPLLIIPEEKGKKSYLSELKQYPGNANSREINKYLGHFDKIKALGILECNLSSINPEVINELAKKGKYLKSSKIRSIRSKAKRKAIIICFLYETSKSILDYIISLYKTIFTDINRRSTNEIERIRNANSKKNKGKFKPAGDFIKKAFLQARTNNLSLSEFVDQFNESQMLQTAEACEKIDLLEQTGVIDHITNRLHYVRQFSKSFLRLDLEIKHSKPLLQAITILRRLHSAEIEYLPEDVPTSFLTLLWKACLKDEQGNIKPAYWEMGFYYALKKKISAGDVYLNHSRNNRYFWDTVSVNDEQAIKPLDLSISNDFDEISTSLIGEYHYAARIANNTILENDFACVIENKLELTKEDALEIPQEVKLLKKLI